MSIKTSGGSLGALVLGLLAAAASPVLGQIPASRSRIVFLGTGNPNPDPERSGPSVAIIVDGSPYIVDAGPGVVRRAAAASAAGVNGLEMDRLTKVFITHLHSDHTVGLADLIFTPWVIGRNTPIELFGPKGVKAMSEHLLAAYSEDIRIRTEGLEHANPNGYKVNAREIEPGITYQDPRVTVKAFLVNHGSWAQAFGYRFEAPDRVIVVSGDTAPTPAIAENCNGCDVLIHEVYSEAGFAHRPPAWQQYHTKFHTSSRELAAMATKAKPKTLILYHQLIWDSTEDKLLDEVRSGYSGRVISAHDLDVY